MKRKRTPGRQPANGATHKAQAATRTEGATAAIPASSGRRWCFRLLAVLAPLLLLGLAELGLRLMGYGYSTAFFLKSNERGLPMLTDNPKFGWRFFPPAVARAPRPLYLAARKPPDTVRVFVFGESAAMGDPEPAYGFGRQLEQILQARHPERKVEVINAAMTAINSHVIRLIAQDCAAREGDFWLVYAGNNEVIGPFGAGTIFGRQAPALATVRLILALKATRLGQLLTQLTRSATEPAEWQGLEFFLKWRVPRDSPGLKRVYASFAANLAEIADLGRRSGATVLLSTIPVNLHECPPLASLHRPALPPEGLAAWEKWVSAAFQAQTEGRFNEALSDLGQAAEVDPDFAELAFQRARCERALNQTALAEADFRVARDLDALRFRADSRINETIRQMAKAKGVALIDAEQAFAADTGEDLFYDHVHMNFTGNYRLALLFAAELERHWPGARSNDVPWLAEAEVRRRLAYTGFDEKRVGEEMRARLQQPPFNSQSNFRARDERWRATLAALSAPPASYRSNYQTAVALGPKDWLLHANFARLLEAAGNNAGAATQWTEVGRLLPRSPEPWANLGRLARLAGDPERANRFLQQALALQPASVETLTELGILEASLGNTDSPRRRFLLALRLQPGFSAARVNLGLLLAHEGDVAGATAQYLQALRWHTNNVEARINLGNLLAAHGQTREALTWYEQAVTLEPDNPVALYNLGRLLAADNRAAEAVTNFQAALRQRPDMAEIHYELGQALARLGQDSEALQELAQAVRLRPDLADAHLNYGVALARSRRFSEAVVEFREALRLHPEDPRAQRMLDQAARAAAAVGSSPH